MPKEDKSVTVPTKDIALTEQSEAIQGSGLRLNGLHSKITQSDIVAFRWLGQTLIPTGMLPKHIKTPGQMIAIMLIADELGIGRMTALRGMYIGNDGKPSMTTQLALAKMRKHPHWGGMVIKANDDGSVTCTMTRKGEKPHSETFGHEEAKALGLHNKRNYNEQRTNMYKWRAIMACGRVVYPDVLEGIYSHEEMGLPVVQTDEGHYILDENEIGRGAEVHRAEPVPDRDTTEAETEAEKSKRGRGRPKGSKGKKTPEQKAAENKTATRAAKQETRELSGVEVVNDDAPSDEMKTEPERTVDDAGNAQRFTREQSERIIELFTKTYDDRETMIVSADEANAIKKKLASDQSYDNWRDMILKTEKLIATRYEESRAAADDDAEGEDEGDLPDPFAD